MLFSSLLTLAKSRVTAYAILIVVTFGFIKEHEKVNKLEYKVSQNKSRVSIATKIVERYVASDGTKHTVIQPEALTRQQAKNFLDNDTYVNDTLVKALDIAKNKISELSRINADLIITSKGTVSEPTNPLSPVTGADKWLNWTYNPLDTTLGIKYDLDLNIVGFNKRKKILGLGIGDKEYFEDLSSPDKRLTIKGVDRYIKPVDKSNFAFRLSILSRYNLTTGSGRVGPNAELDYKRFTLGSSYVYVPGVDRWEWVIEPKFRLVSF